MDNTSMIIIGIVIVLVVGAAVAAYYYRKKSTEKLFNQIFESSRQVPKKKKNSFLLLMFMETISASSKKSNSAANINKLNNPKYLEVQLLQMTKIIKNGPKGQNKKTKQSLRLLKEYLVWEEKKKAENSKSKKTKAAS